MMQPYCSLCKTIVEAVARPCGYEVGLVINTEGSSAGRWEDGTEGTTPEDDLAANDEETVYCLKHPEHECDWLETPG